jgi:hypothetical protein
VVGLEDDIDSVGTDVAEKVGWANEAVTGIAGDDSYGHYNVSTVAECSLGTKETAVVARAKELFCRGDIG